LGLLRWVLKPGSHANGKKYPSLNARIAVSDAVDWSAILIDLRKACGILFRFACRRFTRKVDRDKLPMR